MTISARDVQRLDSHRLQVLLAARAQWAADGVPFRLTDIAPSFRDGLERLGLAPGFFDEERAT